MKQIFGISFGETHSCIATLDRYGNPTVIYNVEDAKHNLNNAVFFEDTGSILVGDAALDMLTVDSERVVLSPKSELRKPDASTYLFDGITYTPTEICSLIIKRLKMMGLEQGYDVSDVVLVIPAYYGMEEKVASINMCKLAQLNVVGFIEEPTAAAWSFYHNGLDKDEILLVFDLGGGSFDASVLRGLANEDNDNREASIKIIAISGNELLGGKAWDNKLFDYVLEHYCEENAVLADEISIDTWQIIRNKVMRAKNKLSIAESATLMINTGGVNTCITVTRKEFEALTSDLVLQTMASVDEVLQSAGIENIDRVLLVGGACRMPMIYKAIESRFPGKVFLEDPEMAIAKGAAIYGGLLQQI